ncbi:hypothetical protein [Parabacteroides sp. AM08-6]|uniref:hypothetical protein n=1 Tax=Parabacteroides sp. AM08-6 TaxID=2292053 RepID=UPI0011C40CED|nr:hypothetical protein [Parabacteroides sp. AM08-6]
MEMNYLFPAICKKIGWILLIPFGLLSIYCLFEFNYEGMNPVQVSSKAILFLPKFLGVGAGSALDEIATIGLAISLLLVGFSKEKDEDECIAKIRMNSLVWAILVNYLLLILATLFIYEVAYLSVAFVGMFTVLIFFIAKYKWELNRFRKNTLEDE